MAKVEEKKVENKKDTEQKDQKRITSRVKSKSSRNSRRGKSRNGQRERKKKKFSTEIIEIRRVSRMYKGGRRMRLSVFVAVGDQKGRVGVGLGKGESVRGAQSKAESQAKKNMIMIPMKGNTIPHEVSIKYKAARLILKPAPPGTGVVAGSSVRIIAEVAGIKDLYSKILGTRNKISNAYATIEALKTLRSSRL